jgi:formate dehydrogenase subunit gamma
MIRRHSSSAIAIHWFNAFCWFFLLCTGYALLTNPDMQPIGRWWSSLWANLFGEAGLLKAHITAGIAWIVVYAIYVPIRWRGETWPFLKEILKIDIKSDIIWSGKKGLWLMTDEVTMRRFGVDPAMPPQGFYNAGQKMVAILAVLASIGLMVTGIMMLFLADRTGTEALLQVCLLLHLCCAGIMTVFIPVHVYMAAFAPGERPALISMFTGLVPVSFIRHHNPLWYKKLRKQGELPNEMEEDHA